jgi:hypothetical protein
MELFLYGLLAGIALGMWLAILLYTVAAKRREGLSLRRRKERDAQLSARAPYGRPADDFDDYYEQRENSGEDHEPVPATPPAQTVAEPAAADEDEAAADGQTDEEQDGEQDGEYETDGDAYRRLLDKMDGDAAAAQRLIDYEQQRAPAAPRQKLIQNALDRLDYGPQ